MTRVADSICDGGDDDGDCKGMLRGIAVGSCGEAGVGGRGE